jgi:ribosomal protein S18 acetylase RimI-like enzyme
MIQIIPCKDRFEELVHFVTRLNKEGIHHIGFFGESEADIRDSLAESLIPPAEGFMLAFDDKWLIGIFGLDANPEINRVWLFGPIVEHEDWQTIADDLYLSLSSLIPATTHDQDIFCDVQNIHLQEFASRHEFPLTSENAILTLMGDSYTPLAGRESEIISYEEGFFPQFETLHKQLFPTASYTARQIVEKTDQIHHLFLAVENAQLLGYHFCKTHPESESGYIDFIGTDETARGRGIGADLLASGIDWMLSAPTTHRIDLTVNADNIVARNLYEKFGFVTDRIMRGYRKRIERSQEIFDA